MAWINEILDFSKVEAFKLSMEKADQAGRRHTNVANLLSAKAEEKRLEFVFDVAADIQIALVGDAMRLGQVLVNLGSNAVKFTDAGQVVIGAAQVSGTEQEVELHFWVTDSGIGMTPEQQTKLFHRSARPTRRRPENTGAPDLAWLSRKSWLN